MANKKISAMTDSADVQATDLFPLVRDGENLKATAEYLKAYAAPTAGEVKTLYESNADTNAFTDAQETKLAGIATAATANDTDANLKNRTNHTGTQTASTISDFSTAADARITAQKAQNSGLASLDSGGKVPTSQLPAIVLTDVFVVVSEAAQLALTAEEGDVAVRTDENISYIHNGGTAGTMGDWQELLTPTDTVISVNGQTGAVTLTTTHVTEGSNLYYTDERVDDRVAALIQNGTGITWSYNDGSNTLTPTVTITQYTDEMAMDAAAAMIQNGGGIVWTYDDGSNTLTPAISLLSATAGTTAASKALIVDANKRLNELYVTSLYARRPPVSVTAASKTLALTDADTRQECDRATAQTITVPPNSDVAFDVGTEIDLVQLGAGQVTLAQGSGVTISSVSGNKKISAQYAGAILIKQATNTWILIGSLSA